MTQEITSLADYLKIILSMDKKHLLFRGERLASRDLKAKIGRIKKPNGKSFNRSDEQELLKRFEKRAKLYKPNISENKLELLMLAQHHGLPTRLIDFTTNPLVALYFSVERESKAIEGDSVVHILDDPKTVWEDKITDPFLISNDVVLSPFYIHERMHNQQSRFILVSDPNQPLTNSALSKLLIKNSFRKEIKKHLNICGINRMNLFDNLDAVSDFISWGMSDSH